MNFCLYDAVSNSMKYHYGLNILALQYSVYSCIGIGFYFNQLV